MSWVGVLVFRVITDLTVMNNDPVTKNEEQEAPRAVRPLQGRICSLLSHVRAGLGLRAPGLRSAE